MIPSTGTEKTAAAGKRRVKIPNKRSINLATVNEKKFRWGVAIPAILLIVLTAAVFGKFAVVDRLAAVSRAQSETGAVQRQVDEANRRIENFGELNDIYAHYTYSGFTAEELELVKRVDVMEVLERVVLPRTPVDSWTLSGNQLSLSIDGATLQEINLTVQALQAEDIVAYCSVNTAATNSATAAVEDNPDVEIVTARIVVYLTAPEEVTVP